MYLPKNIRTHHVIYVSELEPFYENHFERKKEQPLRVIVNNEEEYKIEKILHKRKHNGKIQYRIKCKVSHISETSWEPETNLNCPELLQEFIKIN